jgi:hypothetical protein
MVSPRCSAVHTPCLIASSSADASPPLAESGILHQHLPGIRPHQRLDLPLAAGVLLFLRFGSPYSQHLPISGNSLPLLLVPNGQQLPPPHPRLAQYSYRHILGFLIYHSKHYTLANLFLFAEHAVTRYLLELPYKVQHCEIGRCGTR